MSKPLRRYFITKYALSTGIEEINIPAVPNDNGYLSYIEKSPLRYHSYRHKEWHESFESAAQRANEMRLAKIVSLKKQIAKSEKLTFGGVS